MDRQKIQLVIAILLLVAIGFPVEANNTISASYGETWIRWDWNVNATLMNVYIDGALAKSNTTQTFYQLVNLNPKELHSIGVYNGSDGSLLVKNEKMTLISTAILYFWLLIIIGLVILIMVLSDMKLRIAVGVMAISFIIYDITLSVGNTGFSLIAYALVAFVGYFMVMAIWDLFKEQMKWT